MQFINLSVAQCLDNYKNTVSTRLAFNFLEKHGEHLPLKTHTLLVHAFACESTVI